MPTPIFLTRCIVGLLVVTAGMAAAAAGDATSTASVSPTQSAEAASRRNAAAEPHLLGEVPAARAVTSESEPAIPVKVRRYALKTLARYDVDGSGRLEPDECRALADNGRSLDADGDNIVTLQEWTRRIAAYGRTRRIRLMSLTRDEPAARGHVVHAGATELPNNDRLVFAAPGNDPVAAADASASQGKPGIDASRRGLKFYVPVSQLPRGLPDWFIARDRDGDGQLTLAEFSPRGGHVDVSRFAGLDQNGDGLITAQECVQAGKSQEAAGAVRPAG